jgi:hypothetical protein
MDILTILFYKKRGLYGPFLQYKAQCQSGITTEKRAYFKSILTLGQSMLKIKKAEGC